MLFTRDFKYNDVVKFKLKKNDMHYSSKERSVCINIIK